MTEWVIVKFIARELRLTDRPNTRLTWCLLRWISLLLISQEHPSNVHAASFLLEPNRNGIQWRHSRREDELETITLCNQLLTSDHFMIGTITHGTCAPSFPHLKDHEVVIGGGTSTAWWRVEHASMVPSLIITAILMLPFPSSTLRKYWRHDVPSKSVCLFFVTLVTRRLCWFERTVYLSIYYHI